MFMSIFVLVWSEIGRPGRRKNKEVCVDLTQPPKRFSVSGEDSTAIELFIVGVQSWDTGLRRVPAASADEK